MAIGSRGQDNLYRTSEADGSGSILVTKNLINESSSFDSDSSMYTSSDEASSSDGESFENYNEDN